KGNAAFVGSSDPQALLIMIFNLPALVPIAGDVAVANNGSAARCFRNDRRIMRSDLSRNGLHRATHFGQMSAAAALASWFGLLWRLRLSSRGRIAVKQHAMR